MNDAPNTSGEAPVSSEGARLAARHPRYYRVGIALDRLCNAALLNGDDTQTMSENVARRRAEGARWACHFCAVLDILVERGHCDKQSTPGVTPLPAAIRAGLAIVAMCVVLGLAVRAAAEALMIGVLWAWGALP